MFSYIIRRLLYAIPVIFGVMLLTFTLFFVIQSPQMMARKQLGKLATPANTQAWLAKRGYDRPRFFNTQPGKNLITDTIFYSYVKRLCTFDLGISDRTGRSLNEVFRERALPSILLTVPAFIAGFIMAVGLALYLTFIRHSKLDFAGGIVCIALMSLPPMLYIIFGQAVVALSINYFPASGYALDGFSTLRFLMLPVTIMVAMHLGYDVLLYRAIFLEEIAQDYVRTAQAKGVSSVRLLFVHVLKNGLIALITLVVAYLPLLVMGSVLLENFFNIPGLGNLVVEAIHVSDFATIMAVAYVGALLYLVGLLLTDICYGLADPRIRLS